jgi:SAM-dependent methyltransferase
MSQIIGVSPRESTQLPVGPGRFEIVNCADDFLVVVGWLFCPGRALDSFRLELDHMPVGAEVPPAPYDAVLKRIPEMPEGRMSLFRWRLPIPEERLRGWVDVEIFGRIQGTDVTRMSTVYRTDYQTSLPDTPVDLRFRVTGARAPIVDYRLAGLQSFGKFHKCIQQRLGLSPRRLLDWGCGCGRVTSLLVKYLTDTEVHGCDIDREAVQWCAQNLSPGRFTAIPPYPPTAYADNMFDVVTACSVLTHLNRELQLQWLLEMRRILRPGGLLLASVHGDFAALAFTNPPYVKEEVRNTGISDRTLDDILKGIAPDGYYRGTFQSKEYVCREFARYFEVLEYVELGMGNLQDLVVMRKPLEIANVQLPGDIRPASKATGIVDARLRICANPVFVVGSPRSGTTIMAWSLAKHSHFWTSDESQILWDLFEDERLGKNYLRQGTYDGSWLRKQHMSREEYLGFVGIGFNALFTSRSEGKRWVDQTPIYLMLAHNLVHMFPGCFIIHILRDGRSVVHSMINYLTGHGGELPEIMKNSPHPEWATDFRTACRTWRHFVNVALDFQANHPTRCLTVRYEQLVADPVGGFGDILRFLEAPLGNGPSDYFRTTRINSSFPFVPGSEYEVRRPARPWLQWTQEHKAIFLEETGPTMARCGFALEPEFSVPEAGGGGAPIASSRAVSG